MTSDGRPRKSDWMLATPFRVLSAMKMTLLNRKVDWGLANDRDRWHTLLHVHARYGHLLIVWKMEFFIDLYFWSMAYCSALPSDAFQNTGNGNVLLRSSIAVYLRPKIWMVMNPLLTLTKDHWCICWIFIVGFSLLDFCVASCFGKKCGENFYY